MSQSRHGLGFRELFKELTGQEPYPWQCEMYDSILQGNIPHILDIPTGLGKTSIITIWLIALCNPDLKDLDVKIPLRLVYIVDRRVIVDQASDEVDKLKEKIHEMKSVPEMIKCLNVSKLRGGGGMADSREWLTHPEHPAIIIGTVDMIGSRLFFSGYGLSDKIKPFYAGLLGQDSLIILDETHLSPALECALKDTQYISNQTKQKIFPPRVLLMSATQRNEDGKNRLAITEEDLRNRLIKERYTAEKCVSLVSVEKNDLSKVIVEHALQMHGKTLIYLQKPKDVEEVTKQLKQNKKDAVMLTGTLRGFERDELTKNTTYRTFLNNNKNQADGSCFLVSTSAGEVGVDLDADHMICDLTTLDSLIQRLGRVNRSGGRTAKILVVYSDELINKNTSLSKELQETKRLLEDLTKSGQIKYNASPANLAQITSEQKEKTFAPPPDIQPLTQDILNTWSMTSIYEQHTSRPSVHYWLRGNPKTNVPETHVVWREDVKYLVNLEVEKIRDVLDNHRIMPHEVARDSSYNVLKVLKSIKKDQKIVIIEPRGTCKIKNISEIEEKEIRFATLLLPCSAGGLGSGGILSTSKEHVKDVTDDENYKVRSRLIVRYEQSEADAQIIEQIAGPNIEGSLEEWLQHNPHMSLTDTVLLENHSDDSEASPEIRYYSEKPDRQQSSSTIEQSVDDHLAMTEETAKRITKDMKIEKRIKEAIVLAAKYHDVGKKRKHWQACMRVEPGKLLAKTGNRMKPLPLGGFRHELASVVDCAERDEIKGHVEKDLILHLIASHHGWSRPCFKPNALLKEDDGKVELENTIIRYNDLQKRFGVWGLAWLESVVKGADWQASKEMENVKQ